MKNSFDYILRSVSLIVCFMFVCVGLNAQERDPIEIEYSADYYDRDGNPVFCSDSYPIFFVNVNVNESVYLIRWYHSGYPGIVLEGRYADLYTPKRILNGESIGVDVITSYGSYQANISVSVKEPTRVTVQLKSDAPAGGFCKGKKINFTATSSLPDLDINFTWLKNGKHVHSANGKGVSVYATEDLDNNDQIQVAIQSPSLCVVGKEAISNILTMQVNELKRFVVRIDGNTKPCTWRDFGMKAHIEETALTDYTIDWYLHNEKINNQNVVPGDNSLHFRFKDEFVKKMEYIKDPVFKCVVNANRKQCLEEYTKPSNLLSAKLNTDDTGPNSFSISSSNQWHESGAVYETCEDLIPTFKAKEHPQLSNFKWYIRDEQNNRRQIGSGPHFAPTFNMLGSLNSINTISATADVSYGCSAGRSIPSGSISFRVVRPQMPVAPIIHPGCTSVTLEVVTDEENSYWDKTRPATTPYVVTQPGVYYLYARYGTDCWSDACTVTVTPQHFIPNPPIGLPEMPTIRPGCKSVILEVNSNKENTYWDKTRPATTPYIVTQPGTYYLYTLRGDCWSEARTVTVTPEHFFTEPAIRLHEACNAVNIIIDDRILNSYYFQSSATTEETDKPFNRRITETGTYHIRGRDTKGNWGCPTAPIVVSAIPEDINCDCNYIRERTIQQRGITEAKDVTATNVLTGYTYFDGLGRPEQSVTVAMSPGKKDMVIPISYDALGREALKYLPYMAATDNGSYQKTAVTDQGKFYAAAPAGIPGDTRPYSETIFESSPRNRIVEQYGPGAAWHSNKKSTGIQYQANAANTVTLWKVTDTGADGTGYYDAGTLYRTVTLDEDSCQTVTYTDLQGRTVQQEQTADKTAVTQYVYDDFGRLKYVLPPMARGEKTFTHESKTFKAYMYAYVYDRRGLAVKKHIPGAGWTYTTYNCGELPVLTQTAEQRTRATWSFIKYDAHARPVMTGLITDARSFDIIAEEVSLCTWAGMAGGRSMHEYRSNAEMGYSNRSYPVGVALDKILTVSYYDDYDFALDGAPARQTPASNPKGMLTGGKVRVLPNGKWLTTIVYYDPYGQVQETLSRNITDKWDRTMNEYDFTGRLTASIRTHQGDQDVTISEKMGYDHAGRLLTVKQTIDNTEEVTVAENRYNDLGQLIQTKLHNGALEATDYSYNIRGWMTSIDGTYFKERLHYHGTAPGLSNTAQWGGNINTIEWKTPTVNDFWHAYAFKYDDLSRLSSGTYARRKTTVDDSEYGSELNYHNESYQYDLMGNITTLNRRHANREIDKLTFAYEGNRLAGLSDALSFAELTANAKTVNLNTPPAAGAQQNCRGFALKPGFGFVGATGKELVLKTNPAVCPPEDCGFEGTAVYTYDVSGRLTDDSNRGVGIQYNHLNLVTQVAQETKTLRYTYDAAGRRLQTTLPDNSIRTYVDGIEYQGNSIDFITTPYGRIRKNGDNWIYDYFLKDHLGNVRVVLTTDPAIKGAQSFGDDEGKVNFAAVLEVNAYYPYGRQLAALSSKNTVAPNAYKYNGKEQQDGLELGWLDYGARMLDGPRWMVPDPLAESYYNTSPYAYALNNPVRFIDPNGMWVSSFITPSGRIFETRDDGDRNIYLIHDPENWDRTKDRLTIIGQTSEPNTLAPFVGNNLRNEKVINYLYSESERTLSPFTMSWFALSKSEDLASYRINHENKNRVLKELIKTKKEEQALLQETLFKKELLLNETMRKKDLLLKMGYPRILVRMLVSFYPGTYIDDSPLNDGLFPNATKDEINRKYDLKENMIKKKYEQ